ncbi:MAG: type II toxin-antitoxin system RelE/ParE family toxin [Bacteroidales bacterium]|nr:type II toxin-antitoxin system RelE/ParE family toxin [Bacteroidales bacterium]
MNYTVLLKEEVNTDIKDAYQWYESRQESLGERFLEELEDYIKVLKINPQIYQVRKGNRRYCPMKIFPYLLVYEIEDRNVVIYAVFNAYQHPFRLDKR